jgi:hypothetical protein
MRSPRGEACDESVGETNNATLHKIAETRAFRAMTDIPFFVTQLTRCIVFAMGCLGPGSPPRSLLEKVL